MGEWQFFALPYRVRGTSQIPLDVKMAHLLPAGLVSLLCQFARIARGLSVSGIRTRIYRNIVSLLLIIHLSYDGHIKSRRTESNRENLKLKRQMIPVSLQRHDLSRMGHMVPCTALQRCPREYRKQHPSMLLEQCRSPCSTASPFSGGSKSRPRIGISIVRVRT